MPLFPLCYNFLVTVQLLFSWNLLIFRVSANLYKSKVLILGAGMSGIKAADVLQSQGIRDFIIVEGSNRIGGRLLPATLRSGHTVNVGVQTVNQGGNWIEGTDGAYGENPVWTLAKSCNLSTITSNFDDNVYFIEHNGTFVNQSWPAVEKARNSLDSARRIIAGKVKRGEYPPSASLREALSDAGWHPTTPLDNAIEWYDYDFEYGEPPDNTSAQYSRQYSYFWGDREEMVVDQRGYNYVIEYLAMTFLSQNATGHINDSRLHLNAVVREIDYTGSKIQVTTTNEEVYMSDYVICTFSIGVLQKGNLTFKPALPQRKVDAIRKYQMVVYTNIFLKFEQKFWPFDNQNILFASDRRGYFTYHFNFAAAFENDPNWYVLLVTAEDELSKQIENQAEKETVGQVMDVLKEMYGSDIPSPVDVVIPVWYNNPLFYGSYSNCPNNFTMEQLEGMAASVDSRLYFAGEAVTNTTSGYVQSAYLSGEATGLCIFGVETNNSQLKENCPGNLETTAFS